MRTHQPPFLPTRRRGAAIVEFAVIVPVFLLLILGMIEIGRAIMVSEALVNTARVSARMGIVSTSTTAAVKAEADRRLSELGITGATVVVTHNGVPGEISGAKTNAEVGVTISVAYSRVSWLPESRYLTGRSLTGSCVMRHE